MADTLSLNMMLNSVGPGQYLSAQSVAPPECSSAGSADSITGNESTLSVIDTPFSESQNTAVDGTQKSFKNMLDEILAQSPGGNTEEEKDLPTEINAAKFNAGADINQLDFLFALGMVAISAGNNNVGIVDTQQEATEANEAVNQSVVTPPVVTPPVVMPPAVMPPGVMPPVVMPQVLEFVAGSGSLPEQNMAQDTRGIIDTSPQNKDNQPAIDQFQAGLNIVLGGVSKESANSNVSPEKDWAETIDSKNGVINIKDAGRLPAEAADADQILVVDSEKSPAVDKPEVSGNQDAQKVSSLNAGLYVVEDKFSDSQPQFIGMNSQKGQLATENETANVISSYQQNQKSSEVSGNGKKEQPDDFSNESVLKDLAPDVSSEPKGRVNSDLRGNSEQNSSTFGQILTANNGQTTILEQTSSSVSTPKAADNQLSDSSYGGVKEQIHEAITGSLHQGDKEVTIHLNPPELGKVSIKFQEQNGQITGLLEVDKPQTRYEIEHSLPEIIRNLTNSGIQIRRVEVVLTEQSEQQLYKEQSMTSGQEGHWGQQGFTDSHKQENYPNWMDSYDWSGNNERYYEFDQSGIQVTEDSLNMLV